MRRILSVCISLGVLAAVYLQIDPGRLPGILASIHQAWFWAGVAVSVPLVMVMSGRFLTMAPGVASFGYGESVRLILAASTLNLVLPSKMGDIAKAYFIRSRGHMPGGEALALVIYEKGLDMLALLVWCVFGLALHSHEDQFVRALRFPVLLMLGVGVLLLTSKAASEFLFRTLRMTPWPALRGRLDVLKADWSRLLSHYQEHPAAWLKLVGNTFLLSCLHMLQIWLFMISLGTAVPLVVHASLTPLAMLCGLLPMTFAGVGTRDAALVYLYRAHMSPATAAALGILCFFRYVIPALGGVLFFHDYLKRSRVSQSVTFTTRT